MNKLITNIKTLAISLTVLSILAMPEKSQADDLQRLAENLCDYAKNNNRASMRKKLKSSRMKLKMLYPGLICGKSGSLMRVAVTNDSIDAAKFIATKAGKKGLAAAEKDGKTVLEFTEALVAAGDATKQPFVDLIKSKL
ncbi:MAG: DUF3718 domain-containing protein [Kangiellaceae bacterium]|nr:DUF3718 domain-containing protein [Kangiellaceae bacterium]